MTIKRTCSKSRLSPYTHLEVPASAAYNQMNSWPSIKTTESRSTRTVSEESLDYQAHLVSTYAPAIQQGPEHWKDSHWLVAPSCVAIACSIQRPAGRKERRDGLIGGRELLHASRDGPSAAASECFQHNLFVNVNQGPRAASRGEAP